MHTCIPNPVFVTVLERFELILGMKIQNVTHIPEHPIHTRGEGGWNNAYPNTKASVCYCFGAI